MKRSRPLLDQQSPSLGLAEFVSTLNGDDPRAILSVLKWFSKTVQKERRLAFRHGENDNETEEDEMSTGDELEDEDLAEEDQDATKNVKRVKKQTEEWMEDTQNYQVPFVGTSVAKGTLGKAVLVQPGQWPTGMLQAYLETSPLAAELLGTDLIPPHGQIHQSLIRHKKGKLSRVIYKAYLRALAELLTAAVPIPNLRREVLSSTTTMTEDADTFMDIPSTLQKGDRFLSAFSKNRISELCSLLNDETDKGGGKHGMPGGCGILAAPALQVLRNFSLTSTVNARLVARTLSEGVVDGVFRLLLRPAFTKDRASPPSKNNTHEGEEGKQNEKKTLVPVVLETRVGALQLARILVQVQDSDIAGHVCTAGSRERKIKPGIVYLSLRQGLSLGDNNPFLKDDDGESDKYFDIVTDLLRAVRLHILERSRIISRKALSDLFSWDALHNLCSIGAHAPTLEAPFDDVLTAQESSYVDLTSAQSAAVEARRLLFLLLAGKAKSPFLNSQGREGPLSKFDSHLLVRVMLHLFQAPSSGLEVRKFFVHCMTLTPSLLPAFVEAVTFPETKHSFRFISHVRFTSMVLRNGPTALTCIPTTHEQGKEATVDEILSTLFPAKLNRQKLSKAIQVGNALVVLECLKLIITALHRFGSMVKPSSKTHQWSSAFVDQLATAFLQKLPDLQVLLALRTRFDAFSQAKGSALVNECLFRVFDSYAMILPASIKSSKFDWIKLLPMSANAFSKASRMVQERALNTVELALKVREGLPTSVLHSCNILLEIMLATRFECIHEIARRIIRDILTQVLKSRMDDPERVHCIDHEISCWIDGLTLESLPAFCKLLVDASTQALNSSLIAGRAWEESGLPKPFPCFPISPLLTTSLTNAAGYNKALLLLTMQVAVSGLLFHKNPIPLAAVLKHCNFEPNDTESSDNRNVIVGYACSLIINGPNLQQELGEMIAAFSSHQSILFRIVKAARSNAKDPMDDWDSWFPPLLPFEQVMVAARLLLHMMTISEGSASAMARCLVLLRRITPLMLQASRHTQQTEQALLVLTSIYKMLHRKSILEVRHLDLLVASSPGGRQLQETSERINKASSSFSKSAENKTVDLMSTEARRHAFLHVSVLGPVLPSASIVRTRLELLESCCVDVGNRQKVDTTLALRYIRDSETDDLHDRAYEPEILKRTFHAWWGLCPLDTEGLQRSELLSLADHLSSIFARLLSMENTESAVVYTMLIQLPANKIVGRCLEFIARESGSDSSKRTGGHIALLKAMVNHDFKLYAPSFLNSFAQRGPCLSLAFDKGVLDAIVYDISRHADNCLAHGEISVLFAWILSRGEHAIALYNKGEAIESAPLLLDTVAEVLRSASAELVPSNLPTEMTTMLHSMIDGSFQLSNNDTEEKFYRACLGLLRSLEPCLKSPEKRLASGRLASALLVRFCDILPGSLAARSRVKKRHGSGRQVLDASIAFDILFEVLNKAEHYDDAIFLRTSPALMRRLFRACLKIGITEEGGLQRVLALSSLRLVHLILSKTTHASAPLNVLGATLSLPSADEVYTMAVSHSKFYDVLSLRDSEQCDEEVILAIVQLLLLCVTLSPNTIVTDIAVKKALLAGFDAGLGEVDTTIRRFFNAFDVSRSEEAGRVPFLDAYHWGGVSESEATTAASWDSFLNRLDNRRIRATLIQFPMYDSLYPDTSDGNEIEIASTGIPEVEVDSGEEQELSHDGSEHEESFHKDAELLKDVDVTKARNSVWQGEGRDIRYSPPFMLQLILGSLESGLSCPPDGSDAMKTSEDGMGVAHDDLFASIAYRLCTKGALSLSLASLCSKCSGVRKLALSTLALFLAAFKTAEAKEDSSWRERPQLAMIVNAVQRAMSLRYGRAFIVNGEVPMLPALVAIFLARATLSMSTPESALYVPLNRFFLKTEHNHGAFQDTNRIPAFISLFCSSSDEHDQSRKERLWAIQLLKDGCLDPYCFRLVAACHAPELILTSYDNFRARDALDRDGNESSLLLDATRVLIENGGSRAATHIIGRMGLLSWLRAITTGRPLEEVLGSTKSIVSFLKLVSTTVEKASSIETLLSESLIQEVFALVRPVLNTFLVCPGAVENSQMQISGNQDSNSVAKHVCRTLGALGALSKAAGEKQIPGMRVVNLHADGVSLRLTSQFLDLVPQDLTQSVAFSLTCLPISYDEGDIGHARRHCAFLLGLVSTGCLDGEIVCSFLARINLLTTLFGHALDENGDLLLMLVSKSRTFVVTDQARELWLHCLELLCDGRSDSEGGLLSVAMTIVKASIPVQSIQ